MPLPAPCPCYGEQCKALACMESSKPLSLSFWWALFSFVSFLVPASVCLSILFSHPESSWVRKVLSLSAVLLYGSCSSAVDLGECAAWVSCQRRRPECFRLGFTDYKVLSHPGVGWSSQQPSSSGTRANITSVICWGNWGSQRLSVSPC